MVIEIGIVSAMLTMFLSYCIGSPGSKFSPHEIFSSYTVLLAKRRLKQVGLFHIYEQQLCDSLKGANISSQIKIKNDFKKMLHDAADPFFTWERAAGMCPVCTGFWVALASGLAFTQNILHLIVIVVISHCAIRLFNRIYE